MNKLLALCKAYILEILLALFSVAVIAGYCCGFGFIEAEWLQILLAVSALVVEVMIMLVLNAFFPKPGESSPFMLTYMSAYIILTGVICMYSILYTASPIIMASGVLFFAIILFFLSLVLVIFHRTTALYRSFTKGV